MPLPPQPPSSVTLLWCTVCGYRVPLPGTFDNDAVTSPPRHPPRTHRNPEEFLCQGRFTPLFYSAIARADATAVAARHPAFAD
jgi:hypothetical protein